MSTILFAPVNVILFIAIHNSVYAKIISLPCNTVVSSSVTGIGATSTASCGSGETMVSCGIIGTQDIGGTFMQNGVCTALSMHNSFPVQSVARCCTFPIDSLLSVSTPSSSADVTVSITCSGTNSYLTGCQIYYDSGSAYKIRGSYTGNDRDNSSLSLSWTPTNNQCNAEAVFDTTVTAWATCLTLTDDYILNCETKAVYTKDSFGECNAMYSMTACNTLDVANSTGLDRYYVDHNGRCAVQKDNYSYMYANAICCQLLYETTNPTDAPTKHPTITTNIPTWNPTDNPTIDPTMAPSVPPTMNPSLSPTYSPSLMPTHYPSDAPSSVPTYSPIDHPTMGPSLNPSPAPTESPSIAPTQAPTMGPTQIPTFAPSNKPTLEGKVKEDTTHVTVDTKNDGHGTTTENEGSYTISMIIIYCLSSLLLGSLCVIIILLLKRYKRKKNARKSRVVVTVIERPTVPTYAIEGVQLTTMPLKVSNNTESMILPDLNESLSEDNDDNDESESLYVKPAATAQSGPAESVDVELEHDDQDEEEYDAEELFDVAAHRSQNTMTSDR